jgi:hypothetical protein
MTQAVATSLDTDLHELETPFPRSWMDHLVHWISRIPGPTWLFYVALFLIGAFLNNAARWLDGLLEAGSFSSSLSGFLTLAISLFSSLFTTT